MVHPGAAETATAAQGTIALRPESPWHPSTQTPEPGRKIVALYGDGGGARLLYVCGDYFMDAEGYHEEPRVMADFALWAYVPNAFPFQAENAGEVTWPFGDGEAAGPSSTTEADDAPGMNPHD